MASSRIWLALPVVVLALIVALLLWWRPLDGLSQGAPPVEEAAIERVNLRPGMISLDVRTDGSPPVVIAQVQVDTAYRLFTATPLSSGARILAVARRAVKLSGPRCGRGSPVRGSAGRSRRFLGLDFYGRSCPGAGGCAASRPATPPPEARLRRHTCARRFP